MLPLDLAAESADWWVDEAAFASATIEDLVNRSLMAAVSQYPPPPAAVPRAADLVAYREAMPTSVMLHGCKDTQTLSAVEWATTPATAARCVHIGRPAAWTPPSAASATASLLGAASCAAHGSLQSGGSCGGGRGSESGTAPIRGHHHGGSPSSVRLTVAHALD